MNLVKMTHPSGLEAEVPESAVGHHAMSGWVPASADGEHPDCPTCGQPWPTADPPPDADQQDQAPAESGASSSEQEPPRRRRQSSKGSE